TKQPITDKLSAIGCLKGVLIPVSKTGVSPSMQGAFMYEKRGIIVLCPLIIAFILRKRKKVGGTYELISIYQNARPGKQLYLCESI
ncbi:hypothetical protein, partial [Bacillus subtilis]|uniref:hypothetical protein n=1 Tax=Bacillus subtilis TaxID=1423 RepID=UPI0019D71CA4